MMSSSKAMCIGYSRAGQPSSTGSSAMPAIGTCTARMYDMALRRLSKMRRPRRTAATMAAKLSSTSTSEADSRATSVPRPPMATPTCAARSAGASFTPSPVMATMSPRAFSACTMRSFCSGAMRAQTLTVAMRSRRASSLSVAISSPDSTSPSRSARPAWWAMARAVAG